ncbi:MAG: GNAT family N-acetyltransferase [Candidatus Promineifilaceae bacterium]|nr:GNAT family N-acetyltransferase [Candidatus Promineifilaceae bacterium]
MGHYRLRPMNGQDGPALEQLDRATPDSGRIGFATEHHFDYVATQRALRPNFVGLVAEADGHAGLVGSAMMSFGQCQVEGQARPYAYLGGLGVHPDFRRRGIGSSLARRRVELARQRFGDQGIIFAGIQGGNEGSVQVAMTWANQRLDDVTAVALANALDRPPAGGAGLQVRQARPGEMEAVSAKQNDFYRGFNLYSAKSGRELSEWLAQRPFGQAVNGYYVAVAAAGTKREEIVAGVGVTREGLLQTMRLVRMPLPLRLLNLALRLVPRDGLVRRLNCHWFWFADGRPEAGTYLWQSLRWQERETASTQFLFYDGRSAISQAIPQRRFLPSEGGTVAVHAPVTLTAERPLYFNNMPV